MGEETKSGQTHAHHSPQEDAVRHPGHERNLNPNRMAGQNIGPSSDDRDLQIPTAYDVKDLHRSLHGFSDDELKQVPILPNGFRLQQGATYVDLAANPRREFTAEGTVEARDGQYVVPKDRVPYWIWNRLIGEPKPGQE